MNAPDIISADWVAVARLTSMEREILRLTAKGMQAREIGTIVGRSHHTVIDKRKLIYRVLDVGSAAEAAVIATKAGLMG